jgi:hypothetical protein
MKYKNKLTVIGQAWVSELLAEEKVTRPENPFIYVDDTMYMKYDGIRIKNLSRMDGKGVEVGYYYNGQKVCVFPVSGISLDVDPELLADVLNLDGMTGSMKMVLVDNQ